MKTILCYGDSNTWGYDAARTTDTVRVRFTWDERWPGVLQQLLGRDYHVIEEALCGRTTVWEDPIEGHKSGKTYLIPCLDSHAPIDLVILMLGSNDLKKRFSLPARDIAAGIGTLVGMIQASGSGPDGQAPRILIVTPPPLGILKPDFQEMFEDAAEKTPRLAAHYQAVAERYHCGFLDTTTFLAPDPADGLHLDVAAHRALGDCVAPVVVDTFRYVEKCDR
jgi:lysophospholipase L1-like esterase